MEFRVRQGESEGIRHTEILIQKDNKEVCRIRNVVDSVSSWRYGFMAMTEDERAQELEKLVASVTLWLSCYSKDMEARPTYLNVVQGLFDFFERKEGQELRSRYPEAYSALLHFLFEFRAHRKSPCYTVEFRLVRLAHDPIFHYEFPTPEYEWDAIPKSICAGFLIRQYKAQRDQLPEDPSAITDPLEQIIENYEYFCAVVQEADYFTLKSFVNFSKALVEFIERDNTTFGLYAARIPGMCASIVKNELDSVEDQKLYLGRILNSEDRGEDKLKRLDSIVDDIKEDMQRTPEETGTRLATVISLIAEHYLAIYDLEQAVRFWNKARKRDWLLRLLLSIYQSPGRYLAGCVAFFLVLLAMAAISVHDVISLPIVNRSIALVPLRPLSRGISWLAMVSVYGSAAIAILWVDYVLLWKRKLYYSQLFLPRLLGAIVVSLTVLLVQDTPWRFGMVSNLPNLSLACLIVYTLSFAYIFTDVYNTTKFLRSSHDQEEDIIQRAVRVSRRIFSIALIEAFLVVLLASSLFFPAVDLNLSRDSIGGVIFTQGKGLSFGFFPALVIFWTGLALFIGAFVQLLWQDKRITASE